MNTVFLDSVGMLAQWDKTDQWHNAAAAAYQAFVAKRARTVSTTFVFLECGNAAARRPYRPFVADMRQLLQGSGRLIEPTAHDWETAWATYASGDSSGAGIVDHVSFIVMRRLGISDVFTNDRHFKTAGFNPLF